MNWLINEFVDKWISWVMNWLMNEWINQSIKEWINQSINEWINQSNNELIKQLIIETSFNQLINEWMNEWMIVMFVYLQVLLCVNSSANLFIYSCVGGQFRFTIKLWNRRRYLSNLICLFAVVTKANRFFSKLKFDSWN